MASKQATVEFIADQIENAGVITFRKMFGEYALYCDTKVVAFVCDDQLFIKPTDAGKAFIGEPTEAPAYPGSKMYYLIDGDQWEDRDWMTELVKRTADALPLPKPKKLKRK